MKRKKVMGILGSFLILMLLLTIVSRSADSMSIANVKVKKAENKIIEYKVSGSGKVVQRREQAVSTESEQKIKAIYENEGELIEKGTLLFEVDLDTLKEQILERKQELQKMDLEAGDSSSQSGAEQQKKDSARERAVEDYNIAGSKSDREVQRAAGDLQTAQSKLDLFRKENQGTPNEGEDLVEKELQNTCAEKEEAYTKAVEDLAQLEKEIEKAVDKAIEEAENKKEEMQEQTETEGVEKVEGLEKTEGRKKVEDPKKIEDDIRKEYKPKLDEAKKKVKQAEAEKETAKQALEVYKQSVITRQEGANATTQQQLIEEVQAKQVAYEEAVAARNESLIAAGRGITDANLPEARNSADKINSLLKEQKELSLKKLENLLKKDGKIVAPVKGVITKIAITTGDKTSDGTAILLADLTAGSKFTAQISADQEKHISKNDEVKLILSGGQKDVEGLKLDTIRVSEADPEMLEVTINIDSDLLEIGTAATFEAVKKSKPYPLCIPIEAVHTENNKNYVYITEESESVLGKEIVVRKLDIEILEKNEKFAAIAQGSLSSEQEVIVESDKDLIGGSRVRLMEQ